MEINIKHVDIINKYTKNNTTPVWALSLAQLNLF